MEDQGVRLRARRAIEALRAGVPNREAVETLGIASPAIEERFLELLSTAHQAGAEGISPSGFLVAGNFGSGKSHLLHYCQHLAAARRFVTSKVVISKETPLHDPMKLFRAAIGSAIVPDRRGSTLGRIAEAIDTRSDRYRDFSRWVQTTRELNGRFAATLHLFEHAQQDPELQEQILAFWGGDPIGITELKRALRATGEQVAYAFDKIDQRTLALQRFRFAARLMLAAGYSGWVLLIDEVELVARYSLQQRARSYAELARWTGNLKGESYPGIVSVFALTSDFESVVLDGRHDRENVPARLQATGREADALIAGQAERGMRLIGRAYKLPSPSRPLVKRTKDHLRATHGLAYGWEPPQVGDAPYTTSTSMREYVRWWITEWDLKRLFPDYQPSIEVTQLAPDLSEDREFERPAEDEQERPPEP